MQPVHLHEICHVKDGKVTKHYVPIIKRLKTFEDLYETIKLDAKRPETTGIMIRKDGEIRMVDNMNRDRYIIYKYEGELTEEEERRLKGIHCMDYVKQPIDIYKAYENAKDF